MYYFLLLFQILAIVAEQGTGIEMNATWSTEVQYQKLALDLATWSSSTFKSGLPYYGKLKVTTADNQPAAGTSVEICAHPTVTPKDRKQENQRVSNGQKYCSIREADTNGFVSFELLPSEPEITEYYIKVKFWSIISRCWLAIQITSSDAGEIVKSEETLDYTSSITGCRRRDAVCYTKSTLT